MLLADLAIVVDTYSEKKSKSWKTQGLRAPRWRSLGDVGSGEQVPNLMNLLELNLQGKPIRQYPGNRDPQRLCRKGRWCTFKRINVLEFCPPSPHPHILFTPAQQQVLLKARL